jgi:hypothetical protein
MTVLLRYAGIAFLGLLAAIQLIRPARTNPPTDPARTLDARLPISTEVSSILKRACRDCHSNDTVWPWYSNVAPASWIVIDHVRSGRRHFNYSDWAGYAPDKTRKLLQDICDEVSEGSMPMGSYTLVHRDARLSDADRQAICAWTASLAPHSGRP